MVYLANLFMLTFEAIRDLERGEAETKTLQKLPDSFMDELRDYMAIKESIAEKTSADIHEMENVKRSIRRLLEMRERKLTEQALYTVRTGYPAENLAKSEERLYHFLVEEIKKYRESFFRLLNASPTHADEPMDAPEPDMQKLEIPPAAEKEKILAKETPPTPAAPVPVRRYRVTRTLPKFVGPDMNVYELKESHAIEEGQIPKPLNDLLLKKGLLKVVL